MKMIHKLFLPSLCLIMFLSCNNTIIDPPIPVQPKYTVTYDGNGNTTGDAPTDTNSYYEGDTVIVARNGALRKDGYIFQGWNTKADGTGEDRESNSTFKMISGGVVLFAKWTPIPTYMVIYDGNGNTGGTPPIDLNKYVSGRLINVLSNISLTKTGYSFIGWNTEADGTGISYIGNDNFFIGKENITLYATWTLLEFDGPSIVLFDFSPKIVDVTSSSANVTITAHVTDASGIKNRPEVVVQLPTNVTGTQVRGMFSLTSGTKKDGIWTAILTIPQGRQPGDYAVFSNMFIDLLNNSSIFPVYPTVSEKKLCITNNM